jgi:type I restriction enzyme S subunit
MRSESMFKETALGLRPSNWDEVFLGDVFAEVNTRVKDLSDVEPPVLSMTSRDGLVLQSDRFKNRVASSDISNYKVVSRGQLVYGFPIDEGVIAMLHRYPVGVVSPAYNVWKPKINFDMMFMDAMLRTPSMVEVYKRFASTSVHRRRNLSKRDFKRVPVVLPPLPEQHAIADALCTVQQAKEATEQVIDAVGELKKSLMRYLFMYGPVPVSETGKVLLRDTQAGSVPEHWTVMALGQVVESSFSGGTPSTKVADYWNGDIPWITSAAIAEEDVILQKHQRFITDLGLSKSAAKMAPKDAVIVGTRVGIGKAVVAPSSVAMNQDLTALVLDTRRVEPTFLAYLFKTDAIQRSMQLLARGTTIKGVPRNDLLDLLIPLPPLNKQHAITRILRLVDGRLVAERNKKQALDALFNTLLLNLMEGKVRLPEFAGGE